MMVTSSKTISVQPKATLPWEGPAWCLTSHHCTLHDLMVQASTSASAGGLMLCQYDSSSPLGRCTNDAVLALGRLVDFPAGFVTTLRPSLRAAVINDRIQDHENCEVSV